MKIKEFELYHYGVKGQRWGIRRYQNDDGTLTPEGIKRYGVNSIQELTGEAKKLYNKDLKESVKEAKKDVRNKDFSDSISNISSEGKLMVESFLNSKSLEGLSSETKNRLAKSAIEKSNKEKYIKENFGSQTLDKIKKNEQTAKIISNGALVGSLLLGGGAVAAVLTILFSKFSK